jgi:PAT family beta-lactamase induction signal transducer AmpG
MSTRGAHDERPRLSVLVLLGALYFTQGLPFGFFVQAIPVLLRQAGHSLEKVSLASLLALPWALKALWAPLVDRHGSARLGRRKSWILPMQLALAGTLVVLSQAPPTAGVRPLLIAFFVVSVLSATQDVATDALAIDLLRPHERGLANGLQVGAYRFGMILGGGAMLLVIHRLGWQWSFLLMALAIGLATIPALLLREPAPHEPARSTSRSGVGLLRSFFARSDAWRIVALVFLYKVGDALSAGMVRPFFTDRGLDLAAIGLALGIIGSVSGMVGALVGGASLGALGLRRTVIGASALQAVAIFGYFVVAYAHAPLVWIYVASGVEHLVGGAATASLFAAMMQWCRDEARATDYTIQASLFVWASGLGELASGFLAARVGYAGHFSTAFVLSCLAPLAVYKLWPSPQPHAAP